MHYLLTGTAWGGEDPWNALLLGGEPVGDEEEHDIGYGLARILLPPQVTAFSHALDQLDPAKLGNRFNPAEMTKLDIYPSIWDRQDEPLEEWLQESLVELQGFLRRAVAQQQAVIVAIL